MNTISEKIQLIINTIQTLDIKAEYETMNRLMGCLQLLMVMKKDSANWVDLNEGKTEQKSEEATADEDSAEEEE